MATVLRDVRPMPCEHLQLALPTRHLGCEWGKPRRQRSAALPLELVGEERYGKPGGRQDRVHDAIEAVGNHHRRDAAAPAELQELGKPRIDANLGDRAVDLLGRGAQQLHLTLHAFARGDAPTLPELLDLAPGGVGEALEQPIRRIVRCDRAVEIDQGLAPRERGAQLSANSSQGLPCPVFLPAVIAARVSTTRQLRSCSLRLLNGDVGIIEVKAGSAVRGTATHRRAGCPHCPLSRQPATKGACLPLKHDPRLTCAAPQRGP